MKLNIVLQHVIYFRYFCFHLFQLVLRNNFYHNVAFRLNFTPVLDMFVIIRTVLHVLFISHLICSDFWICLLDAELSALFCPHLCIAAF